MRILLLAQALPYPADTRARLRALQTLRYLAREHTVHVVAFARHAADVELARMLDPLCASVHLVPARRSLPGLPGMAGVAGVSKEIAALTARLTPGDSYLPHQERRAAMGAAVRDRLRAEQIDVIHLDGLGMAQFVPANWTRPLVLDERVALWSAALADAQGTRNPARRWLLGRESRVVRGIEADLCRRATVTLAGSEADRAALEQAVGTPWQIHVVPLGIEMSQYDALWQARSPERTRLLTMGTFAHPGDSNAVRRFLRDAYPALRQEVAELRYDIVATRPTHRLRAAAEAAPWVELHADAAETDPFWEKAGIFLALAATPDAPVRILEALTVGVPVIATAAACAGIAVTHEEHLLLAETPDERIAAVRRIVDDPLFARKLILRGRRLIEDRYETSVALTGLGAAYEHVVVGASRCVLCS